MSNTPTVEPAAEPVTLAEVKESLRYTSNAEDARIAQLAIDARRTVENWTGRQMITATFQHRMDAWPCSMIHLSACPVQSVTSIQYVDANGDTQTWSSEEYDVDVYSAPARIMPAYGYTWPIARAQPNAITVTYLAGYGDNASDVPSDLRRAVILLANEWFVQPDAHTLRYRSHTVPDHMMRVIDGYVVPEFK